MRVLRGALLPGEVQISLTEKYQKVRGDPSFTHCLVNETALRRVPPHMGARTRVLAGCLLAAFSLAPAGCVGRGSTGATIYHESRDDDHNPPPDDAGPVGWYGDGTDEEGQDEDDGGSNDVDLDADPVDSEEEDPWADDDDDWGFDDDDWGFDDGDLDGGDFDGGGDDDWGDDYEDDDDDYIDDGL